MTFHYFPEYSRPSGIYHPASCFQKQTPVMHLQSINYAYYDNYPLLCAFNDLSQVKICTLIQNEGLTDRVALFPSSFHVSILKRAHGKQFEPI